MCEQHWGGGQSHRRATPPGDAGCYPDPDPDPDLDLDPDPDLDLALDLDPDADLDLDLGRERERERERERNPGSFRSAIPGAPACNIIQHNIIE